MFRDMKLKQFIPFNKILRNCKKIDTIRDFYAYYGYSVIPLFGAISLYPISPALSFFSVTGMILASCDISVDYFSFGSPAEIISTLVGFSPLFHSKAFHNAMWVLIPLYGISIIYFEAQRVMASPIPSY